MSDASPTIPPAAAPAASRAWVSALATAIAISVSLALSLAPALRDQPQLLRITAGWLMALVIVAPMLAVPIAIALRRTRPLGLAVTVVGSIAALYPAAIFAFYSFAFDGMSYPVVLFALTVLLLVTGIAAYRSLPAEQRISGRWVAAFLIVMAYVAVARVVYLTQAAQREAVLATANANDRAAQTALTETARCAREYHARTEGYPHTLDVLVSDGCLSATILAAGRAGHAFEYAPGVADARGNIPIFTVSATPIQFGISGWQTAFIDDTNALVVGHATDADTTAQTPAELFASADVWGRRVRFCAVRAATEAGYPEDLVALRAHDPQCLPWETDKRVWYSDQEVRLSYITETHPSGPAFVIVARTASGNVYFDSEGHWGAIDPFAPGRAPTQPQRESTSPAERQRADTATPADLERGCEADVAADCLRLGNYAVAGTPKAPLDRDRAKTLFTRACTLGLGSGCTELADLLSINPPRTLPIEVRRADAARARELYLHACDLGDDRGCERAAHDASAEAVADRLTHAFVLFERGCALRNLTSCTRLTHTLLGSDELFIGMQGAVSVEMLSEHLTALCDGGDAAGCYLLGRVLSRPGTPPADRHAAERLLFAACDAWPDYGCVETAELRLDREVTPSAATLEIAERGPCLPTQATFRICGFVKTDYTQRCDAGDRGACFSLARQFFGDDLDRAPPNEGWDIVARACTLGETSACDMQLSAPRR